MPAITPIESPQPGQRSALAHHHTTWPKDCWAHKHYLRKGRRRWHVATAQTNELVLGFPSALSMAQKRGNGDTHRHRHIRAKLTGRDSSWPPKPPPEDPELERRKAETLAGSCLPMNVQHATYRLMCKLADGPVAGSTGNGHHDVDLTHWLS
jgi:hypothetical protein